MRMDIVNSPGARGQRIVAAARDCDGLRLCEGEMSGKRLCSMGHPATVGGERASRTLAERTMGVLWRHSSFNLVEPRSIALAAAHGPQRLPGIAKAVASPSPRRNRCGRENDWRSALQFRINHLGVIQAFGFNDLAGDHD
jgi:hypothetical protein